MNAVEAFGPAMVWEISRELIEHELVYQVLSEAAISTAEEVALDKVIGKAMRGFVLSAVIMPYRIYRIVRFINWIKEVASKPKVRQLLEDVIRRVCVKRCNC